MEKIVGKCITIILLLSSYVYASQSSIGLSLLDMDGKPIEQVMVQSQFILQVSLNNVNMKDDISYISGMDAFAYSSAGRYSNVFMNNGTTIRKNVYKFVMRADNKGVYKIGPLVYSDKSGVTITSNVLSIKVADEVISSKSIDQIDKYMITMQLDKKVVYVGEKVTLQIDFLDYRSVEQLSLLFPDFNNIFTIDIQSQPTKNIQQDNGHEYKHFQWFVHLYPTVKGFSVFDNIQVRFLDPELEQNIFGRNFFGLMGSMMNMEQKLRASPIGLQVLELPQVQGFENVTAVGQFSKIEVSVDKNEVQQGQGIVLTAKIFGDGNFEKIESLSLSLPQGLVFYDSGVSKIDNNRTYKHFEFIIQAQESGNFHIPAQQFHYFNPETRQYQTIQSNPLDIIITENPITEQLKDQNILTDDILDNDQKIINDYMVIDQENFKTQKMLIMIPLVWYTTLFNVLYYIFLLMFFYRYFIKKYILSYAKIRYFILFFQAKRACKIAEKNRNVAALYSIFMNIFVHLHVGSFGSIQDAMIEQFLKNKNFSDDVIVQWKLFNQKILQASFAQKFLQDDRTLFKEAFMWLALLKEKV